MRSPREAVDPLAGQLDGDVVLDEIGRRCVSRGRSRLFDERAELDRQEAGGAGAQDEAFPAQAGAAGLDWPPGRLIPDGVAPAAAMLQAAKDAEPRRTSVLEHALANDDAAEYHPIGPVQP